MVEKHRRPKRIRRLLKWKMRVVWLCWEGGQVLSIEEGKGSASQWSLDASMGGGQGRALAWMRTFEEDRYDKLAELG